jgi:ATP-dependent HslUV protease subunit HslV
MTTIATDGVTIAADKLLTFGHERSLLPIRKMLVQDGRIYAMCGPAGFLEPLAKWHTSRGPIDAMPKCDDVMVSLLVIDDASTTLIQSKRPYPVPVIPPFAIGAGAEFAMGAMHAGATAEEAVGIACRLSTTSGGGIDTIDIAEAFEGHRKGRAALTWGKL